MKRRRTWILWAAQLALTLGCEAPRPKALVKSAKLGVFFGGQIEERREIAFELGPAKQAQGFRVEFSEPLAAETEIEWQLDMPVERAPRKRSPQRGAPTPAEPSRATVSGKDVARVGQMEQDHVMSFHPGDPLGLWNVRVVVRGKVVIDRPVEIYDAAQRQRLLPKDAG